ncbi:MAG: uroporphyrinogen decarboxylase family protein [Christensenella sp.]
MNERERFLNQLHYKPVDKVTMWPPLDVWDTTWKRWAKEGHTDMFAEQIGEHGGAGDLRFWDYFGCDHQDEVGIYYGFSPGFEYEQLGEDEHTITFRNHEGIVMQELKEGRETSMPHWLDFPIKSREDFRKNLYRWELNFEERFPANWEDKCKLWKQRKIPLRMWADREGGFFGPLRNLFGIEDLSYLFYDDIEFIEEVLDAKVECMTRIINKIWEYTDFDYFVFWEDMCYKNGPLLSPEMFKKYLVPRYRKITDLLRSKGVDLIFVDSDGDVNKLVPLWLEAGVNGILPFEVQCGMDVNKFRKEYGKELLMMGGINKRALITGGKDIDDELRRVAPLVEGGGYIPWLDHSVPPDVSYDNFLYYMDKLEKLCNGTL